GDLALVDLESGRVSRLVTGASVANFQHLSPDGRHIAYTTFRSRNRVTRQIAYSLYVLDSPGTEPRLIVKEFHAPPGVLGGGMSWSPDGQFLAGWVSRETAPGEIHDPKAVPVDLMITSSSTGQQRILKNDKGPAFDGRIEPRWSPDGESIFLSTIDS